MGGDNAPELVVRGAVEALGDANDFVLVLVGDEAVLQQELEPLDYDKSRVELLHASQTIGMGESPVEALRHKRDSSILKIAKAGAAKEVDAVISAGNTGAFVAACQLKIRPIAGVARPGIAVAIPSFHGPFVLCDAGANIQPKAQHLHQYGVMAALYAQKLLGIERPRVALLSVGEESVKGTALVKQTQELLKADEKVNFVGNVEGRQLFDGVCDVALSDGFVGNLMLKFVEGVAEGFLQTIGAEVEEETGLSGLKIIQPIVSTYHTYHISEDRVLKKTKWFEMMYEGDEDPKPQQSLRILSELARHLPEFRIQIQGRSGR